jgi:hypothetical protein
LAADGYDLAADGYDFEADGYDLAADDSDSPPNLFVRNPWPIDQTIVKTAIIRATGNIFSNPSK